MQSSKNLSHLWERTSKSPKSIKPKTCEMKGARAMWGSKWETELDGFNVTWFASQWINFHIWNNVTSRHCAELNTWGPRGYLTLQIGGLVLWRRLLMIHHTLDDAMYRVQEVCVLAHGQHSVDLGVQQVVTKEIKYTSEWTSSSTRWLIMTKPHGAEWMGFFSSVTSKLWQIGVCHLFIWASSSLKANWWCSLQRGSRVMEILSWIGSIITFKDRNLAYTFPFPIIRD